MAYFDSCGRHPKLVAVQLWSCFTTSKSLTMPQTPGLKAGQLGERVRDFVVGDSTSVVGVNKYCRDFLEPKKTIGLRQLGFLAGW